MKRLAVAFGLLLLPAVPVGAAEDRPAAVDFERDVRPIFQRACVRCHGPEKQKGGLRLDDGVQAGRGGNSGPVLKAHDPDHSRLFVLVSGGDPDLKMPPGDRPLSAAEIARLRSWIEQGAPWPRTTRAPVATVQSTHWAYRPPQRPPVPPVAHTDWVRTPIDAFVLARLEQAGITPSPEADRATLVRRLSLDLLGLPPAPAEVDAFVRDPRPDAYERLVDRLLASPAYGERWARHWLDVARYADSDGYEKDGPRPFAWRYRDWVIRAFNADLPYDQFVLRQLAGDLLPGATLDDKAATGFHRNTLTNKEGGVDREQYRVEQVIDRVNTTARTFLGLTLGCAQCHDHKYDPFSQREYYQLFAFFNSDVELDVPAPLPGQPLPPTPPKKGAKGLPPQPVLPTLALGKPRPTHVLIRGDFLRPGVAVEPDTPAVLAPACDGKRTRLDLARWITAPGNPLTARVFVNWLWHHYFERGLVATLEDFGTQGERPSHPELLDWLATELVRRGWGIKAMHRLIVTSSVYRQSSHARPELTARDPLNVLLAHQNRPRLEAEVLRDAALAVSGLLAPRIGGPSVRPPQPAGISELTYAGSARWNESTGADRYRRGLYTWFQRTSPYPMLLTFDAPDSNLCCVRRERSNTPLQALTLLNDEVFVECARALGRRIVCDPSESDAARMGYAFRLCLGRQPGDEERAILTDLLRASRRAAQADPGAAARLAGVKTNDRSASCIAPWVAVARTILNLDEFQSRD